MRKLLTALLMSSLFFVACHSDSDRLNDTKMVEITSIPEGATIIVNNLNLGKAPLSVEFAANEFGCFIRPVMISALPQEASLHTQVKSYPRFSANTQAESEIPKRIIFDMSIAPESK